MKKDHMTFYLMLSGQKHSKNILAGSITFSETCGETDFTISVQPICEVEASLITIPLHSGGSFNSRLIGLPLPPNKGHVARNTIVQISSILGSTTQNRGGNGAVNMWTTKCSILDTL
ncbi:hypothetical protein CEXT_654271 [Caerostris extrusa]|uniref:Uncharacterized protein n=1 Tax=Caerostris extrusa TaxID=172846 RepID=A0AAV4XH74_CAEEX|nr:hypothetical protein CEXT_654271 [Caerostris extrusa]